MFSRNCIDRLANTRRSGVLTTLLVYAISAISLFIFCSE